MKFLIILSMSLIGHFTLASITAGSEPKGNTYVSDGKGGVEVWNIENGQVLEKQNRREFRQKLGKKRDEIWNRIKFLENQIKVFNKRLAPLYEESRKIDAEFLRMAKDKK